MRVPAFLLLLAACATEPGPEPEAVDLLELVWADSIRPGDLVVAVPGTGMYTDFGARVDAKVDGGGPPMIDARQHVGVVEVLEGAIAAARRAGVDPAAVDLAIWGAGITRTDSFRYASLDGATVVFRVLGGKSTCATGGIPANLTNYNEGNANKDARDLYQRLQAFTADRPRNITLVSHSWGAVVAEYIGQQLATYMTDHGRLTSELVFAVAAGVPAFVPGFTAHGEGFYTTTSTSGDLQGAVKTYEINRPDDPVHTFDPQGNGGGHHYVIRVADEYRGWYGITTDELSCDNAPGICPTR
jgi:pimeloyl-ACP methyl ester carboxylesterase